MSIARAIPLENMHATITPHELQRHRQYRRSGRRELTTDVEHVTAGEYELLAALVLVPLGILYGGISAALQSYLASYVVSGDPNRSRVVFNLPPTIGWGHPNSKGEQITGVVNVGNWFYSTVNDDQNPKSACDFWRQFSASVTEIGGYVPPSVAATSQGLVAVPDANISRNYVGGNSG